MRPSRSPFLTSALLWFGLLGAPAAWTVQLVLGYGVEEAQCSPAGRMWSIPVETWQITLTATMGAVALAAGLSALALRRDLRPHDDPRGRLGFMAAGGLLVSATFLVLIVLGGLGAIVLPSCRP